VECYYCIGLFNILWFYILVYMQIELIGGKNKMKTMICKETKEEFYGIVIGTIGKHTTKYNETVDRWLFRTK